jgi:DNA-directed RNA polymerase specialized sigma24 family protein
MSALPSPADFTAPLRCAGPALRTQRDARRKIEEQELSTLMRFAQSGDRAAYTRLVRRIMPLLQRALRTRHGFLQAADRDDLMQDVLLSVHRAMATYDSRREFIPWLMAIARNKMADRARRFARSGAHEILVDDLAETSPATPSAPDLASRGDVEALRRAICRLSDGQFARGGAGHGNDAWRAQGLGPPRRQNPPRVPRRGRGDPARGLIGRPERMGRRLTRHSRWL